MTDILILYGSHRGTAEKAAEDFRNAAPSKLKCLGDKMPTMMSLDEFLNQENVPWARVVVIFVSSFGLGGAPKGAMKFRKLCNKVLDEYEECPDKPQILNGLQFSLCGFGSTMYKTFMANPNKTVQALTAAGATMIGEQGMIDSAEEEESQEKAFEEWMENIWEPLERALNSASEPLVVGEGVPSLTEERLQIMKTQIITMAE